MGELNDRFVRAEDAAGWVRSAFATLQQDNRFQFGDASRSGEDWLILNVEIIKAYVASLSASKNANVVVRVRYSQNGAQIDEKMFRGDVNAVNWTGGDGEAQVSLNKALKEVIAAVDQDILARCKLLATADLQGSSLAPQ